MTTKHPLALSVIVPTHRGVARLPRLLDSLAAQSLTSDRWEVVFIINGVDDGSLDLLESWQLRSDMNLRVLSMPQAGAGIARNLGLANARGRYLTFVDDDDWLEERYLEVGLAACSRGSIALLPIEDDMDGRTNPENPLNLRRKLLAGSTVPITSAVWALGFNACKFVPATLLKPWRYDEQLQSGEDVVFFANLLRYPELKVAVPVDTERAAYVRTIRENSVSRPSQGFDFNVAQRLDVIAALQAIPVNAGAEKARRSLESSQFGFVENWLQNHPDDFPRAADYALSRGVTGLNWSKAHVDSPKRLVFSFCFPPFADPAANVVAKRIALRREIVDVVSADMTAVREIDLSTEALTGPWVHSHRTIRGFPSFASWPSIASFGSKAARSAGRGYTEIYSRALWSGSHVAGALYKLKHPQVEWEAEFSDPLRWDATGEPRSGGPAKGCVGRRLRQGIEAAGWGREMLDANHDHFALTELAALSLADKVVFSNINQMVVVLDGYSQEFREAVLCKSIISPQPSPPSVAYEAQRPSLFLDPAKTNLAYFGNFYSNRGLGDIAGALDILPACQASQFVLHVFSNGAVGGRVEELVAQGNAVLHDKLSYLDFLGACSQFDALIVVDATTGGSRYGLNPYLPSKFADYAGSGTPIWAIIEPGSPLSVTSPEYVSELGNRNQAAAQLLRIARVRE